MVIYYFFHSQLGHYYLMVIYYMTFIYLYKYQYVPFEQEAEKFISKYIKKFILDKFKLDDSEKETYINILKLVSNLLTLIIAISLYFYYLELNITE